MSLSANDLPQPSEFSSAPRKNATILSLSCTNHPPAFSAAVPAAPTAVPTAFTASPTGPLSFLSCLKGSRITSLMTVPAIFIAFHSRSTASVRRSHVEAYSEVNPCLNPATSCLVQVTVRAMASAILFEALVIAVITRSDRLRDSYQFRTQFTASRMTPTRPPVDLIAIPRTVVRMWNAPKRTDPTIFARSTNMSRPSLAALNRASNAEVMTSIVRSFITRVAVKSAKAFVTL